MEVSFVPVGSNRAALHQASAEGLSVKAVQEWAKGVLDETGEEVVKEEEVKTEPEPTVAEPSGQESKKGTQQEPEEKPTGDGGQVEKIPRPSYDEVVHEIRAATKVGVEAEVTRFVNFWSGRLD